MDSNINLAQKGCPVQQCLVSSFTAGVYAVVGIGARVFVSTLLSVNVFFGAFFPKWPALCSPNCPNHENNHQNEANAFQNCQNVHVSLLA